MTAGRILAPLGALVVMAGALGHAADAKRLEVVTAERGERYASLSETGLTKLPRVRGWVFLRLELRGAAVAEPEALTPDAVVLTSGKGSWRPQEVSVGMPAGDPLGIKLRGPLLLFEVPRNTRHFKLKVLRQPAIGFEAEQPITALLK
jgi:hypothetical protein